MGFSALSTPLAWMGVAAYTLQIYFDFSGYSLMAIGMGKIMGFEFPQNFDFPYISKELHRILAPVAYDAGLLVSGIPILPLGGSRVKLPRLYFNLFVVWFCTGFWHGGQLELCIVGSLLPGISDFGKDLSASPSSEKPCALHIYVLFFLMISWSIFAVTDFGQLESFCNGCSELA